MVYDIPDYWVFELCPLSGILKNRTTQHFENCICFRPQVRGQETPTQLGPLERASFNPIEDGNRFSFRNVALFSFLEYRTMDKVQKRSSPE
jgi:hypothetical protein